MKLNIIDICTSTIRAVNRTLISMTEVRLTQMPEVSRQDVVTLRIMATEGTFVALVMFQQPFGTRNIKGGMLVYIPKRNVKDLFGNLGIDEHSDGSEIMDACGEFCNVMAGSFKTEIVNSGYSDVSLSLPEKYADHVNELIRVDVTCKYKLAFSHKGRDLLSVEVFMEDIQ